MTRGAYQGLVATLRRGSPAAMSGEDTQSIMDCFERDGQGRKWDGAPW